MFVCVCTCVSFTIWFENIFNNQVQVRNVIIFFMLNIFKTKKNFLQLNLNIFYFLAFHLIIKTKKQSFIMITKLNFLYKKSFA